MRPGCTEMQRAKANEVDHGASAPDPRGIHGPGPLGTACHDEDQARTSTKHEGHRAVVVERQELPTVLPFPLHRQEEHDKGRQHAGHGTAVPCPSSIHHHFNPPYPLACTPPSPTSLPVVPPNVHRNRIIPLPSIAPAPRTTNVCPPSSRMDPQCALGRGSGGELRAGRRALQQRDGGEGGKVSEVHLRDGAAMRATAREWGRQQSGLRVSDLEVGGVEV